MAEHQQQARPPRNDFAIELIAAAAFGLIGLALIQIFGLPDWITLIAILLLGLLLLFVNKIQQFIFSKVKYILILLAISLLGNGYFAMRDFYIDNNITSIQLLPAEVYRYGGDFDDDDDSAGSADFTVEHKGDRITTYNVGYFLPPDTANVWAGLTFGFNKRQDLSAYQILRFSIVFKDPDADCTLVIWDGNNRERIKLRNASGREGLSSEETSDGKVITIDLQKISRSVDFGHIVEISFDVNDDSPRNHHRFSISDIRFYRQRFLTVFR